MRLFILKMFFFTALTMFFSGCATKEQIKYIKPKLPKLRTCVVKPKKVSYTIKNGRICLRKKDYKLLKNQNYRLRVCNELLNKQNDDFNKRYAK